jgi:hypothetical protein
MLIVSSKSPLKLLGNNILLLIADSRCELMKDRKLHDGVIGAQGLSSRTTSSWQIIFFAKLLHFQSALVKFNTTIISHL